MNCRRPCGGVGVRRSKRAFGLAFALSGALLDALSAYAQDATWLLNPASGNWNTGANWSPGLTPTGIATFDASNVSSLTFSAPTTSIGTIQFNVGAPAYSFSVLSQTLNVTGTGIYNNSSNAPGITINSGGLTQFQNASTAADALITVNSGGALQFQNTGTAGTATINANSGASVTFLNSSTGGQARFISNSGGTVSISGLSAAGMTAGSIEGGGNYILGSRAFTVGSNNLNTAVSGVVSGTSGSLLKVGTGTLTLSGANTYTGGTTINGGTLQLGDGGTTGSIAGNVTNNGIFAINRSNSLTYGGVISGAGAVQQNGIGTTILTGSNTYTGGTTINAGMLQVGSGGTTGAIVGDVVNDGIFAINRSNSYTYAGMISGAGSFEKSGAGTTTLTGDSTFTSGTTINAGTLRLGNAGLTGSIAGDVANNGIFTFNRSDAYTFDGVITGTGAVQKTAAGTTTLTADSTYAGPTTITAGVLRVNASIVSPVTVNSGGTLAGNGAVGSTTLNAGSILAPGNSIGTITVNGDLVFAPTATYIVEVSLAAADRTNVTGIAALAGNVQAVFQAGSSLPKNYSILSAIGGRTDTFNTLSVTNLPSFFGANLTYTSTDVLLELTLGLSPIADLNTNQRAVAAAIDNAFNIGGGIGGAFTNLFSLSASSLPGIFSQLSGEVSTGAATAGFLAMGQFFELISDPFSTSLLGTANRSSPAIGFAPEKISPPLTAAYDSFNPARKATRPQPVERRWSLWASSYGGQGNFEGDQTSVGSHNLGVRVWGVALGADYRVTPDGVVGFALSGGTTNYGLSNGLGSGRSDFFQAGIYGMMRSGSAYLSAAFEYAIHDIHTDRTIAVPQLTERLTAVYPGHGFGSRIESGYRVNVNKSFGIAPYIAVEAKGFYTPAYRETSATAPTGFGLAYNAHTAFETRSEFGARLDAAVLLASRAALIMGGRVAWGHRFSTDQSTEGVFQALPQSNFTIIGASATKDSAIFSAGSELRLLKGISLSIRYDSHFAGHSKVHAGRAAGRLTW